MTLPELAKLAIANYLKKGSYLDIRNLSKIPKQFLHEKAGVFVSLHQKNNRLRGCIGTFLPTQDNIAEEIIHNAVSAALDDPRFYPVSLNELPNLNISVDILSDLKKVKNISALDPKKYGLIVSTSTGRKELLLPDIEEVDTVEKQIAICRQKAGILPNEAITIQKFTIQRYLS